MIVLFLVGGIGLLLTFCGFLIRFRQAYWLISGFNTMSEEEKSHIDVARLGRVMFVSCLLMGFSVLSGGIFFYLGLDVFGMIGLFLILPIVFVTLIFSQKCNHDPQKTNSKAGVIAFAVFMILIISFVWWVVGSGAKPSVFTVDGSILDVSGTYGQSFDLSEATGAALQSTLPENLYKKNGYNFGTILKGKFDSDIGQLRLYVHTDAPMFLYLTFDDETLIVSGQTQADTQMLYEQVLPLIQSD